MVADMEAGVAPYWLTLSGIPGVGKTFIARQIFDVAARTIVSAATANHPQQFGIYSEARRRPDCRWFDAAKFKRQYLDDKQYDLPEYLAVEWLVGFDDLGSSNDAKDLLAEAYYRLANQRLGKWTVWTTNLTIDEIAKRIDPRVSSRLIRDENRLITITAPDFALVPKI